MDIYPTFNNNNSIAIICFEKVLFFVVNIAGLTKSRTRYFISPLNPQDVSKHYFAFLKNDLIF